MSVIDETWRVRNSVGCTDDVYCDALREYVMRGTHAATRLKVLANFRAAWEYDPHDEWMMFASKEDAERCIAERLLAEGALE